LAALRGERAAHTRIREREPSVVLFVAEPLFRDHRVVGVVYLTRSTRPVMYELYTIRRGLTEVLLVALAITAGITLWLAYSITRPLERLSLGIRRKQHVQRRCAELERRLTGGVEQNRRNACLDPVPQQQTLSRGRSKRYRRDELREIVCLQAEKHDVRIRPELFLGHVAGDVPVRAGCLCVHLALQCRAL
jgi:hypothetical protein